MPTERCRKGKHRLRARVFATTFDRDLIAVPGTGVHEGLPDMQLKLDPERRPGWQPGTEIALGDLYADDAPFALCPRQALKRAIAAWRALGLNPWSG